MWQSVQNEVGLNKQLYVSINASTSLIWIKWATFFRNFVKYERKCRKFFNVNFKTVEGKSFDADTQFCGEL